MPKLIRLLGDADQNKTEIRNTFRQPIIVKPNSKVALVGVNALLTDEVVNENFVITDTNKFFKLGEANDTLNCEMTGGEYYAHPLVNEFLTAGNYAGTSTQGLGIHHTGEIIDNRFALTTHKASFTSPSFNDTKYWDVMDGSAALTVDSVTSTSDLTLLSNNDQSAVPMVRNKFQATLLDFSGGKDGFITAWKGDSFSWGVEVSGGVYYKILNDVHTSLATNWAINDVIIMETYAGGYHLTINSSAGTLKKQEDVNLAIARANYGPIEINHRWYIGLDTGAAMTNCRCTTLYNVPDNGVLTDSYVNAELQFKNASDVTNVLLAIFLGFGLSGGQPINYDGNPATVNGRSVMEGIASYPGILVVIDGLGPLQSYDGAGTSKAPDNILYVLNDLALANNTLRLDIPAPFYLDMNNSSALNVNELRVRFLPATGQKQNPALSFSGNPSVTLLIDG